MKTRFTSLDRNQLLLLPPALRDWLPEDDLNLDGFTVNVNGTDSAQYPPRMMLRLS